MSLHNKNTYSIFYAQHGRYIINHNNIELFIFLQIDGLFFVFVEPGSSPTAYF